MENIKLSIFSVLVGTLLIGIWGLFFSAPTIIKMAFSFSLYMSIIVFPYSYIFKNDYGIFANSVLLMLMAWGLFEIMVTVFNTDADMYMFGNKWITLFLSEYSAFIFLPPVFSYLCTNKDNLFTLLNAIIIYIVFSVFLSVINKQTAAFSSIFLMPFLPYIKKRKIQSVFILAILLSILRAVESSRMLYIVNFYGILALIICTNRYLLCLRWVICIIFILLPFLMFIPILGIEKGDLTLFQNIQNFLRDHGFGGDTTDTRTLLYLEMAEDLTANNSWLLGKGAFCHYFSSYFASSDGDNPLRMNSEVPFLNFLLKGGVVYVILYYTFFIYTIINGLSYGKNKLIYISSIILAGWYLNTFIGDVNGCRFYHICIFSLAGCCLSPTILKKTDLEIQLIFENKYKQFLLLKYLMLKRIISNKVK